MTYDSWDAQRALAEVRFHQTIAQAHETFASVISGLTGQAEMAETPTVRGSLQRRILALPEIAASHGLTSRDVASATTGDEPNCHTALKGLVAKEILEVVAESSPQRFRLAVRHRRDRILRLSRLIESGEWTTYGEFSIAVYDNWRMALAVARVAARHPAFAHPHRVLQRGGSVSSDWHREDGVPDPEECKRRLRDEHVWDDLSDRATPAAFIDWEQLRRRLAERDAADQENTSA